MSPWHVRGASAAVAACTGLPKATDGSASGVPNSAASHASDGGEVCVINVRREPVAAGIDRLRQKIMSLKRSQQRRIHRAINGCRVKRINTQYITNKCACMKLVMYVPVSVSPSPPSLQELIVIV